MTSTSNLSDVVRHYQRSIERHGQDEKRLLHCISKLFNLPIKFEHLQETGIGKTVNALRKINGEIGVAAKTLVTKWKAMVAAQEEPKEQSQHPETPTPTPDSDANRRSSDEDQDQENKGSNSTSGDEVQQEPQLLPPPPPEHQKLEHHHNHSHSGKTKSKHEGRSSKSKTEKNGHHHSSSSSSSRTHSKSKSDQEKKHKSNRHDKSKESHKSNKEHKHEEKSSSDSKEKYKEKEQASHHKSSTSSSKSSSRHEKPKDQEDQKSEKQKSSASASANKSSKRKRSPNRQDDGTQPSKAVKNKSMTEEDSQDGFDSSMGANFDDVLGMLNLPMGSSSSSKRSTATSAKAKSSSKVTTTTTSTATKCTSSSTASSSGRSSSNRKPELLAPTAKLEPLDPSIALELPTISNNYKPMPLNQTVMAVVFNQGGGVPASSHKSGGRFFNESEALAQGISSKTMRTKIYSGVKTGQILQVPSLFDLCTRVLQKNIDALEYTGGVPFEVLRPVLERATPQQLLNFEDYNPYLMDDSEVLWQQHVQRQCRSQKREEMETWREMYLRCQEEKERKLSILSESIKASQKLIEAPVRKTQLAFVDSMVKPPRSVQRKQDQFGTRGKLIATPAARVAALQSVTPNAAKVGDARLRVLAATRDTAQVGAPMRIKKAPLMAKTLQFMRGRHKR
ncbi:transcription elongation factor B polypeptide 3 [Drosophila tropicalis]|uniref:transcription elongation factor B polypeptide 3 n=1 Tax=Drosophila tropicalis TaxID=46794 RepID=UPI0035ABB285